MDVSDLTVEESGSLPRMAGSAKDFVRGSLSNRPFRPGGLDDSQSLERILPDGVSNGEWVCELLNGGPAQTVPPGLKQGLELGDLKVKLSHHFLLRAVKYHIFLFYLINILGVARYRQILFSFFLKAYPCTWKVHNEDCLESTSDKKSVSFFPLSFFTLFLHITCYSIDNAFMY